MKCKKCGWELPEGAIFCLKCGERVHEITAHDESEKENKLESGEQSIEGNSEGISRESIFCPDCGVKNEGDAAFCCNCGNSFGENQDNSNSSGNNHQVMDPILRKRKGKIVAFVLFVAVVAVIVVGASTLIKGFSGSKEAGVKPVAYVKNLGLYAIDVNKKNKESVSYEENLGDVTPDRIGQSVQGGSIQYSEDGRYVFYPANLGEQEDDSSYDLYCRNLKKDSEEPFKIDSSVMEYQLLPDNRLIYKISNSNTLYIHNLEDKIKIASDVERYFIDSNNKYILWNESSNVDDEKMLLYYQDLDQKNDKQKIESDVNYVGASKDFSKIFFMKDNDLYVVHNFGEKEKIASDITRVIGGDLENERFYCIKENENIRSAMDFVDDDYANGDSIMEEPQWEDFRVEKVEKEDGNYTTREELDEDAYNKAYDKYLEKEERDRLREELVDYEIIDVMTELYYYEKGSFEKIDEGYRETLNPIQMDIMLYQMTKREREMLGKVVNFTPTDSNVLVYRKESVEEKANIKLSALLEDSDESWSGKISDLRAGNSMTCIAKGRNIAMPKDIKLINAVYDEKSSMVYGIAEDGRRDLVSVNIEGDSAGTVKLIQEDVNNLEKIMDGDIYYITNSDGSGGKGDLYKNGEVIDYGVLPGSVEQFEDEKYITYITDFNSERAGYTVKSYNNKETRVIAEDVVFFLVRSPKEIVLLADYNEKRMTGDLKLYTGDKNLELLDTEVSVIAGIENVMRIFSSLIR